MSVVRVRIMTEAGAAQRSLRGMSRRMTNFKRPLREIGLRLRSRAIHRLDDRPQSWGNRRKRDLAGSINSEVAGDGMSVATGTNLRYAAIQQYGSDELLGGPILPKNKSGYLWIPVPDSLARMGTWPRNYPGKLARTVADVTIGNHSWRGPVLVKAEALKKVRTRAGKANARDKEKVEAARAKRSDRLRRSRDKYARLQRKAGRRRFGVGLSSIYDAAAKQARKRLAKVTKTIARTRTLRGEVQASAVLYAGIRSADIPARPYLVIDESDQEFAAQRVLEHVVGAAK